VGYPPCRRRSQLSADPLGGRGAGIVDALGNIGDFIGGLAVVVTLVYLAVQVRQNSKQLLESAAATRAETYQNAMDLIATVNLEIAKSPELARFHGISREDFEALSSVERTQCSSLHLTALRAQQQLFLQWRAGLIDEAAWQSHAMGIRVSLSRSGPRYLYESRKAAFSPEFAKEVDRLLESRE